MVTDIVREARRRARCRPRFGLLRLGTGNALAWVIGASQRQARRACRSISTAAGRRRVAARAPGRGRRIPRSVLWLRHRCPGAARLQPGEEAIARGPLRRLAPGRGHLRHLVDHEIAAGFPFSPGSTRSDCERGRRRLSVGREGSDSWVAHSQREVIYEGRARIASVSTIPYYGFGFRAFPFAEERTDRMNLRVSTIGSLTLVANFPAIWKGNTRIWS